jgi:hypothetical protein
MILEPPKAAERERHLLAQLSEALACTEPDAIEHARRALREFYRALGMHP